MSYEVKVVADSLAPHGGRITTFQLRFPKFLLSQFNTHRAISKSARSSRAVPVGRMIQEVQDDPVRPIFWGSNRKGMQATAAMPDCDREFAEHEWELAIGYAVHLAGRISGAGAHKQIVNRLLEPFAWTDVVATATDWMNFFALRCDRHAQPEIQVLAVRMARAYRDSTPTPLGWDEWHLPYVADSELSDIRWERKKATGQNPRTEQIQGWYRTMVRLSVARCARVSYRTFDGKDPDPAADIALHDKLVGSGHWSPLEHVACPADAGARIGNFVGWCQYRQTLKKSVHTEFDFSTLEQFGERGFVT